MSQTSQPTSAPRKHTKQSSAGSEEQVARVEDLDAMTSRFDEVLENIVRHVSQYRAIYVVLLELSRILREADRI